MLLKHLLITCLSLLALTSGAQTPTWPQTSIQTRPGARWWWLGSAVDDDNLSYLMEEYAKKGIGTLEITPIYGVQKATNNITYLSSNWMNKLKTAKRLGVANGIQIDMNMGSGWPFGGPWVPLSEAAGKLVYTTNLFTTTDAAPTITFNITPTNQTDALYSTLNCVMAYPQRITGADTLDVTAFVKDNVLTWTPGQVGRWRIIAVFNGHTRQTVKRAAPGGEGYVLDHLDSAAVANYIRHFEETFAKNGNPYPTTFFNDSYEIFGADWSPRFFDEFERRRGYKLQRHMQELLQLSSDTKNQIRSDYRETMADMYLDNFIRPWNDFAHRHGVLTRNQSHGSPSNLIDTYASVDIPEIEGYGMTPLDIKGLRRDDGFTAKNSSDFATLKIASSAAHLTGKQLTSSETFTWFTEHFRTSLSQMKPEMDLMFLSGVNRMFFHGTTYSPREAAWPGHKFYASIDMSPTNSIWRDADGFMQYVNRCQSFLQWGQPDNDILVYFTCYNAWHTAGTNWLRLCPIDEFPNQYSRLDRAVDSIDVYGYGSDYITDRMIRNLRYEDGTFLTEGGARYKALQIPIATNMPDSTKARLDSLAALGASIITSRDESLFTAVCQPEPMRRLLGLRYIRRTNPTGHHYFIANLTGRDVADYVGLAVPFQSAAIFNPIDGTVRRALVNADGQVYLNLHSGESLLLQTFDNASATAGLECDHDEATATVTDIPLDGPWTLTFTNAQLADGTDYVHTYQLPALQTWESLDENTAQLMGTGAYETTVSLSAAQLSTADKFEIRLGDVRESARVYINNEYVGCAWSVPFTLDCTSALHAGENHVRIEVTNLPANRIRRMDQDGTQWRIFEDINMSTISSGNGVGTSADSFAAWKPVASGLASAVSFRAVSYPAALDGLTLKDITSLISGYATQGGGISLDEIRQKIQQYLQQP